jgi:hypothetical protein
VKAVSSGAATAQAKMTTADYTAGSVDAAALGAGAVTAPKLDVTAISGQTAKTAVVNPEDMFLQVDNTTGLLRMVKAKWFAARPRGYLSGLGIANNVADATNDIDVAVGECRDSTNAQDIVLGTALTKRLDAVWAVGTGQGGLDTGAAVNNWYHVFVIRRADTGVVDALFSLSPTAPTLPTNYTHFRRVGSITRSAGVISGFYQYGDTFSLVNSVANFNTTTAFAKALIVITAPSGIIAFPIMWLDMVQNAVGSSTLGVYPGVGATNTVVYLMVRLANQSGGMIVRDVPTNLNGQLYVALTITGTVLTATITSLGWTDNRGKDGYSP